VSSLGCSRCPFGTRAERAQMEDNVVEVIEKSTQTTILERAFEKGRIELSQVGPF
jgi:hypothetical protein